MKLIMKLDNQINVILTNENLEEGFLKMKNSGVKILHFPLIRTYPINPNIEIDLNDIDCIIFTSKNGVKYFFSNSLVKESKVHKKYFVCIGKKTAQKLNEFGIDASYVCKRNYSKYMGKEVKKSDILKNKKCLLVQGSLSDNSLLDSLISFSNTRKAIFYKTEPVKNKYNDLEKIIDCQQPYVIFTSPSSFDSFINNYDPKKVNIVSIGNTTSSHINKKGFNTVLTSKMQSYEGISESLIAFLKEKTEYELS